MSWMGRRRREGIGGARLVFAFGLQHRAEHAVDVLDQLVIDELAR